MNIPFFAQTPFIKMRPTRSWTRRATIDRFYLLIILFQRPWILRCAYSNIYQRSMFYIPASDVDENSSDSRNAVKYWRKDQALNKQTRINISPSHYRLGATAEHPHRANVLTLYTPFPSVPVIPLTRYLRKLSNSCSSRHAPRAYCIKDLPWAPYRSLSNALCATTQLYTWQHCTANFIVNRVLRDDEKRSI